MTKPKRTGPPAPQRKQAIVVRSDIGMSCGKIAAQCCHAVQPVSKRVILRATTEEFETLQQQARSKGGVLVVTIHDAGLTQVEPGTATVLSLVGDEDVLDTFTKHLHLL